MTIVKPKDHESAKQQKRTIIRKYDNKAYDNKNAPRSKIFFAVRFYLFLTYRTTAGV